MLLLFPRFHSFAASSVLLIILSGAASFSQTPSALVDHTMAVGGVTNSRARVRVHSATSDSVNIEVSTDTVAWQSILGTPAAASSDRNNTVLIDVHGLQPNTLYFYRARIAGAPQRRVQSFRTFPPPGTPATFSVAFGSCQQSGGFLPSTNPGKVFEAVARSGASLFLQIGDWGYPDTTDNLPANNDVFSANYARVQRTYLTKFDPTYPMSDVLAIMPVDYLYDDHDYLNNNASATTVSYFEASLPGPVVTAREIPVPSGARENSIRGYVENMPTYPLENQSRGIYHKFSIGDAEFFMLDLRSQRSPNLESFQRNSSTGRWEDHPAASHSILASPAAPGTGQNQLSWLLENLQASTATWKFLVSTVPFNKAQATALALALLLQDSLATEIAGVAPGTPALFAAFEFADKWAGFPADVDTLLNTIRTKNIKNVIVLSGDSHTAAMDDGTNAGLPEIMAGCLDITNSRMAAALASLGLRIWNKGGQGLTTHAFNNAFGRVTVYGRDSVSLQLIDENGALFASQTLKDARLAGVTAQQAEPPMGFALEQNWPNPFNPSTTIHYTVGVANGNGQVAGEPAGEGRGSGAGEAGIGEWGTGAGKTSLIVYDVLGRRVAALVDEVKAPGTYEVRFSASGGNGPGLASGVYYYRLISGNYVQTRKMILLK